MSTSRHNRENLNGSRTELPGTAIQPVRRSRPVLWLSLLLLISFLLYTGFCIYPSLRLALILYYSVPPTRHTISRLGGPERAARQLDRSLHWPTWIDLRERATLLLGHCGEYGVAPLIETVENRKQPKKVREVAIFALGQIGPQAGDAVPILEQALNEQDLFLRAQAAYSLWRITQDTQKALPTLKDLAQASHPVCDQAHSLIGMIATESGSLNSPEETQVMRGFGDLERREPPEGEAGKDAGPERGD